VDMNLVMTSKGKFIEMQVSGEEYCFSREILDKLIEVGQKGIQLIIQEEKRLL